MLIMTGSLHADIDQVPGKRMAILKVPTESVVTDLREQKNNGASPQGAIKSRVVTLRVGLFASAHWRSVGPELQCQFI